MHREGAPTAHHINKNNVKFSQFSQATLAINVWCVAAHITPHEGMKKIPALSQMCSAWHKTTMVSTVI